MTHQFHLLNDLLVAYHASGLIIYIFHRVGQSAIVGFLVTGVLVGPHGLGLVSDAESVHVLAEIGVMLLLFSIGLEFSPPETGRSSKNRPGHRSAPDSCDCFRRFARDQLGWDFPGSRYCDRLLRRDEQHGHGRQDPPRPG